MYKADIRIDESVLTEDRKSQHNAGVKLKPIRKKGFHRALKRKEAWAVNESFLDCLHKASAHLINFYNEPRELKIIGLSKFIAHSGSGITEDMLEP